MYIAMYIYGHIQIYKTKNKIRRAFGPGRVRSRARTPFLVFWLTPLPPQWTLGVHIGHPNQGHSLFTATLQITKTCTGAEPNRHNEITIMNQIGLEIYGKSPFSLV